MALVAAVIAARVVNTAVAVAAVVMVAAEAVAVAVVATVIDFLNSFAGRRSETNAARFILPRRFLIRLE